MRTNFYDDCNDLIYSKLVFDFIDLYLVLNMIFDLLLTTNKTFLATGDNATLNVKLIQPVAMAPGLRFAIREGGKTVGAGVVSNVVSN